MKFLFSFSPLRSALIAAALFAAQALSAHEGHVHDQAPDHASAGALIPVDAKTDAAWLAKARADYPLDRCLVCSDKLESGEGAKNPEYIYRQAGKPDRLVRFCDDMDCVPSFKKEPEKYLKMIDDAAAEKATIAKK